MFFSLTSQVTYNFRYSCLHQGAVDDCSTCTPNFSDRILTDENRLFSGSLLFADLLSVPICIFLFLDVYCTSFNGLDFITFCNKSVIINSDDKYIQVFNGKLSQVKKKL